MVSQVDGLGSLQVGVPGHRPVGVALGQLVQPRHQRTASRAPPPGVVAHVEGDVGRHLVVSRASGVQLAAERSDDLGQASLDRHVDVLVVGLEWERAVLELLGDGRESTVDLIELVRVEDAGGMRERARAPSTAGRRTAPDADRTRSRH